MQAKLTFEKHRWARVLGTVTILVGAFASFFDPAGGSSIVVFGFCFLHWQCNLMRKHWKKQIESGVMLAINESFQKANPTIFKLPDYVKRETTTRVDDLRAAAAEAQDE